jgi:hypothetical protein
MLEMLPQQTSEKHVVDEPEGVRLTKVRTSAATARVALRWPDDAEVPCWRGRALRSTRLKSHLDAVTGAGGSGWGTRFFTAGIDCR